MVRNIFVSSHSPLAGRRRFLGCSIAALTSCALAPSALHATTQSHASLPPTPQDFGAVADGTTDDSAAIQAWLEHLIHTDSAGYVPSGDYLLLRPVRTQLRKVARFGIIGAGSAVSRFIVHERNQGGGFSIDAFGSRRNQIHLEHFSIIANGSSDVGFQFVMAEGGGQHQRSVTMNDVWARSANQRSDHFKTAFDFTGCWRPRIQNSGWDGPYINVTSRDDSARYFCDIGFNLDGCYGFSIEDSYAWGCNVGITSRVFVAQIQGMRPAKNGRVRILLASPRTPFSNGTELRITGTRSYDGHYKMHKIDSRTFEIDARWAGPETGSVSYHSGPEGMNFKDNTINGVRTGILVERPNGREPTCWINGNHINYRDFGVVLDGIKILQMDQNNTYNEDRAQHFAGTPRDIDLRNTSEYIISAHVFHFDGHPRRIGISVQSETFGEGDNGLIHHCIFSGQFQLGIYLSKNASGVRVGPNLYPGKITQQVWDENGTNLIE